MMFSLTMILAVVCGGLLVLAVLAAVVIWLQNQQIDRSSGQAIASAPPPEGSASLEQTVRYWLGRGSKIEAIKAYRQATGVGLKEAKDAVEAFERGEPLLLSDEPAAPPQSPQGLNEQVRLLLQQGNKIEAIKVYREATGCGLKEAKDAVEAIEYMLK
jgi:ribosomal protein L7/L12